MKPLPIDPRLPEIVETLRKHGRLVLVAPPGAGKTTRVPPAILRAGLLPADHPALIVLQPRRVAARSTAARIAEEQGWTLGQEVGYQVRFERRVTAGTRIRIQTEGILTRQILADPFLESVGAVILDEIHERSIHGDLALALVKEIQREVRRDLMIVAMSATLDAAPVARFLGDCPIIRVDGRTHPVAVSYGPGTTRTLVESTGDAILDILADPSDRGHVLVFLPGMAEIRRVRGRIESEARKAGAIVIPLHGSLSTADQDRALCPSPSRKIILSTNIAETSLTIDGVSTVIDGGLARVAHYDSERGFDRLSLERISRASADQRAGRAGRTGPGRCVRLWSESQHRGLAEHEVPEIHRVDLCETVLALHSWGITEPSTFPWFERPELDRLAGAERLLVMLGAVEDQTRRITALGGRLHALPVHPRLGRLLIAASDAGRPFEGASVAALLSEKDLMDRGAGSVGPNGPLAARGARSGGREGSDVLVRLDLLEAAEHDAFSPRLRDSGVDPIAARQIIRVRDNLLRLCGRLQPGDASDSGAACTSDDLETSIQKWLLLAYPDRVVRRRASTETGVMVGGRGVRLDPRSVVREGPFFLAIDPQEDRRRGVLELQVRIASSIEREWLESHHPSLVRKEHSVRFDEQKRRVIGVTESWYLDLLFHEDTSITLDPAQGARTLAEVIKPRARAWFCQKPEAADWLARVSFLRRTLPELTLADFCDETFAELVEKACLDWRTTRLEDLDRLDQVALLRGRLTRTELQLLDQNAPISLTLPNGRTAKLVYEEGRPPILAVRVQDLFGWIETPRIAQGRVPVLLHLLGPNHRPVQITDDLRGFWITTYFQVRKDLRARYPKHAWPEDPLHAPPIARPRRG